MITKEQILELAKTCGFNELIDENIEIDDEYWGCWEEQLIEFAEAILSHRGVGDVKFTLEDEE